MNINLVALDGGHKSVGTGLASYRSVRHHHNVHTLLHSNSYMDPREDTRRSTTRCGGWARAIDADAGIRVFTIDTLNNNTVPRALRLHEQARVGVVGEEQATYLAARS